MQLTKLTKISTKGFTLIELLVVIAIIGLLATIVAAPIQSARKKAKDTKKLAEVRQMQTSLANYANDTGSYPSGSSTSPIITALSPQYIPSIPQGFTATNARDKYMYVAMQGTSPGSTASTTFAYHLGTTLEVYNTVLASDEDCWGMVSTTTSGVSGNKNGGPCVTFVSADPTSTVNPAYFAGLITPFTGSAIALNTRVPTGALASSSVTFNTYQQIGHPMWPSATADFQGFGTAEYATSTCATVDQCLYDVSDSY